MKPTVGRIVHYHSFGTPNGEYKPLPRAAVITEVDVDRNLPEDDAIHTPDVGLCVLNPTGQFFTLHVPYSEVPKSGHWNWPPREDAKIADSMPQLNS